MWYATQQPRQQFVLEEAIAYDEPLAGLGALGLKPNVQARRWTKAMTGQSKKITRFTPGAQIANQGYVVQPASYDPTVTRYSSPIEQARAAHRRAVGNTLAAQQARQAAALQAQYEQQHPMLFRDPDIMAKMPYLEAQDASVMQVDPETGRLMQGMSGLGREGRYARSMRAIKSVRSSGRVIAPEAAYLPAAYAQQQPQEVSDVNAQFAAQAARPQVKQFSDALWQDPRLVAMMQPDPRTGWAQFSIGPGIGKEAALAKQRRQKLQKYWRQTGM